jgi:hypothetical protein
VGGRIIALLILNGQCHALTALSPEKGPSSYCRGGWVGPKVGLDRCREKKTSCIHWGLKLRPSRLS